ncbi:SDR family NAD(P)-dependent oxidoreductase [Zhongshania aliphaticivorans]|uniref:3-oxoacyl-ACP reductase n=1 Tax=Zhongshania aliphaticivorans TaxID=1470434 RepID=A0A127MAU3_9GAMM|nr:SDR family oxidoreductase [Zhongshania aliphaticivorans]AMO70349.1 3-oxoacyl-ACP reductase [Zhongshania aliphaticivorans]
MAILENKVAVVTGGGQGVGAGIALALAAEGAVVAVLGRTLAKLEATCAEIHHRGGEAQAFVCDVTEAEDIDAAIMEVVDEFGSIDILVNNAQIVPLGRLLEINDDEYQEGMDSGPLATFRFMKACYPFLRGDGSIVNLASSAAMRSDSAGFGAYAAAKEAIRALSRAAACEWGEDNVRVNCIMPLAMSPAMSRWVEGGGDDVEDFLSTVPLGRVGDCEEDVGRVVVFLCGPDASYITGHTLPIDGGQAFLR